MTSVMHASPQTRGVSVSTATLWVAATSRCVEYPVKQTANMTCDTNSLADWLASLYTQRPGPIVCCSICCSVGIELKELGGRVSCRNVWNFAQGLKFKADFHSKMSACRHELGGSTPPPDNSNPHLLHGTLAQSEHCTPGWKFGQLPVGVWGYIRAQNRF